MSERRTLQQWRLYRLLSRKELAEKAGINENTVWALETRRNAPRMQTLRALCKALGVGPEQIIWPGNEEPEERPAA